jgi:hypothetical protein
MQSQHMPVMQDIHLKEDSKREILINDTGSAIYNSQASIWIIKRAECQMKERLHLTL